MLAEPMCWSTAAHSTLPIAHQSNAAESTNPKSASHLALRGALSGGVVGALMCRFHGQRHQIEKLAEERLHDGKIG